ncbi:MAG TPA: hypothetical protein DIV39_00660 [Verrucomicrobiales bacterium]|nr:hypothetical protein [Verrucomicrobiales bacterium]
MLGFESTAGALFSYIPSTSSPGESGKKVAIVLLHGSLGNFQGSWLLWKKLAESTGVAIVAPTFATGQWSQEGGRAAIAEAREFCIQHRAIDENRLVLAGISEAGIGVLREAAAAPQGWDKLLLISPVIEQEIINSKPFIDGWRNREAMIITSERNTLGPGRSIREAQASMESLGIRLSTHYLPSSEPFLFLSDWTSFQKLIQPWLAKP